MQVFMEHEAHGELGKDEAQLVRKTRQELSVVPPPMLNAGHTLKWSEAPGTHVEDDVED